MSTPTTPQALRLLSLAAAATLGALPTLPAHAQQDATFYTGVAVGRARADLEEERLAARQLGAGLATTGFSRDDKDTAYKLFLGYQFNRYFALEGGYFNLGKFGFHADTRPAGSLAGQLRTEGVNIDAVGMLPLGDHFSLIGRAGTQYARTRASYAGSGAVLVNDAAPRRRESNPKVGLGLQYAFSPWFTLRGEAERYRVSDASAGHANVTVASLSLVFPFGRAPAAAPRAMAAPVSYTVAPDPAPPVAVAPRPEVIVVPMAAPVAAFAPARRRVSFSAESLFSFDRAELRPEGQAALDSFVRELDGTSFDVINVEGHTDRLGTQEYNQALSLQRAQAVKAYLVGTGRIDGSKVAAVGKSESQPVTQPDDCKGRQQNAQLIACLQPDRRVEIEVVGTR